MKGFILSGLVVVASLSGSVRAGVTAFTDPPNRGTVTVQQVNDKWRVTYQRDGSANDVSLWVQGLTSDTIEYIRISNSGGGAAYTTFVNVLGYNPNTRTGPVEEITETSGNGTTIIQELRIQGNLGGSVEPCIKTDRITLADISGNVTKGIELNNSPLDAMTVGGNFLGNLTLLQSSLKSLIVAGNIGAPGSPVTFNINDDIQTLQAASSHANITAGWNGGSGAIKRLKATTGNITGSIAAKQTNKNSPPNPDDGITVQGDLVAPLAVTTFITAPVTIEGDMVGNITAQRLAVSGANRGDVSIGGKMLGNITLSHAAHLDTQVIINQNAGSYAPWTTPWAGTISVGGVSLSPVGNYTQNPQTVGAGAVGLAPYTFQWAECDPVHTHSKHLTLQNPVYIKHYGPVERTYSTTASCYTVEFSNDGGQNWTIVSSSFEADPSGSSGRIIAVRPKAPYYWQAGRYRFTPIGGIQIQTPQPYIRCKLVDGEPAVMAYSYWFDSN